MNNTPTSSAAPDHVQVVIIPVAYNRNEGERNNVLDAARSAKVELAKAGLNTWVDMRKEFSPSQKFQWWEEKNLKARVEIGAKEVAQGKFTVADLVNKVKHPTGRMIARRRNVTLEELASTCNTIVGSKGPIAAKGKEGNEEWANLFDAIVEGKLGPSTTKTAKKKKSQTNSAGTSSGSNDAKAEGGPAVDVDSSKDPNQDADDNDRRKRKRKRKSKSIASDDHGDEAPKVDGGGSQPHSDIKDGYAIKEKEKGKEGDAAQRQKKLDMGDANRPKSTKSKKAKKAATARRLAQMRGNR